MKNFFENAVLNVIDNMNENDKITLYNEYCEINNDYNSRLNTYDDINELFCDSKPSDIVDKFSGVCIGYNDYWYFNGYGNVEVVRDINELLDKDNITDSILDGDTYTCTSGYSELCVIQQLNECIDDICEEIIDSLKYDEVNIGKLSLEEFEEIAEGVINDNIYNYEPVEDFVETLYHYILSKFN